MACQAIRYRTSAVPYRHRVENGTLAWTKKHDLMRAVDAHSNPMLGWIVHIALETGMRSSEITTLRRRSQADLNRRIVRLLETKNTLPRTVPLTSTAVEIFRQALANPVRPIDTDLIFFRVYADWCGCQNGTS